MSQSRTRLLPWPRRAARTLASWAAAAWLVAAAVAPPPAEAAFITYGGSGDAMLFDPATGEGGWVGTIDEVPDPTIATPLSLLSTVLFSFDAASGTLSGRFEFTTAADPASTLFGNVSGRSFDADPFGAGGQFEIDYEILGGSGAFSGASGFGLAFLNLDPAATGDHYAESGLLVFDVAAVPLPGSAALVVLALALLPPACRRQCLNRDRVEVPPCRRGSAAAARA